MKLNGYIYFANLINKINKINKIQKLNFLLKINDYISINYKKIKSDFDKKIYMKNIKVEKKIIIDGNFDKNVEYLKTYFTLINNFLDYMKFIKKDKEKITFGLFKYEEIN